jgi:GxxExxY protein
MQYLAVPVETERVGAAVIGASIEVHRHLGAGFLERIYQEALCLELTERGIPFEREQSVNVLYKGHVIHGQRIDLVVSRCVVVELKAITTLHQIHEAKVISYLKTTGLRLGYLLNFNHSTMKEGIKRIVY